MPSTAAAGAAGNPAETPAGASASGVPFSYATNFYAEKQFVDSKLLDAATTEVQHNINPGGFLRGIRVQVRSSGGVGGTATADNPWAVLATCNLANISGDDIIFPTGGYSNYLRSLLTRPWWGDPAKRWDFSASINPAGTLFLAPEIKHTAGVLANTDARATYRTRISFAPATAVITGGTTAPTVTATQYLASYAQPDRQDLHGNSNQGLPDGLALATKFRQNVFTMTAPGTGSQYQVTNTGNELRGMIGVVRTSAGVRVDGIDDPIRLRVDDRSLGTYSPDELWHYMSDQLWGFGQGSSVRPAGVYPYLRYMGGIDRTGTGWLSTTSATFLQWEFTTNATAGANASFTVLTDEVVPIDSVPMRLDSI